MRLLLLSNSTNPGEAYLSYPKETIRLFLSDKIYSNIVFIPYAAVTFSYDEYVEKINNSLQSIGIQVRGIHTFEDPTQAIQSADVIIVGGGNTWKLTKLIQDLSLVEPIRKKVETGTPYIGWSAGSNLACPTLRTTNDMPITEPNSFETLSLIPFQINPHYLDNNPSDHGGETREMRICEFITQNKDMYVVGLREGTILYIENKALSLIGNKSARIFKYGEEIKELSSNDNLSFLLH